MDNPSDLIEREQAWIDWLAPEYNIARTAGSILGVRYDGAKVSAAKLGTKRQPFSDEWRANLSASRTGRQHSTAWSDAISAGLKGKPKTPEHRAALALAAAGRIPWNKGVTQPRDAEWSEQQEQKRARYAARRHELRQAVALQTGRTWTKARWDAYYRRRDEQAALRTTSAHDTSRGVG